jgi:hypothetical protein
MDSIQNRTFDVLKAGETASLSRALTYKDIELGNVPFDVEKREASVAG